VSKRAAVLVRTAAPPPTLRWGVACAGGRDDLTPRTSRVCTEADLSIENAVGGLSPQNEGTANRITLGRLGLNAGANRMAKKRKKTKARKTKARKTKARKITVKRKRTTKKNKSKQMPTHLNLEPTVTDVPPIPVQVATSTSLPPSDESSRP